MSNIKDRLYDYEITPPPGAWEKIAVSLDESALDHRFTAQLYNAEMTPPPDAWQKIAAGLSEPDTGTTYPARLYAMEIDPPPHAWEKIQNSIGKTEETPAPVRAIRPLWKYAAAALLIGAVALGISRMTLLNNQSETTNLLSTTKSEIPTPIQQDTQADMPVRSQSAPSASPAEPGKILAAVAVNRKQAKKMVSVSRSRKEEIADPALSQSIYAYADHVPDVSERYVMLMTPDGNIIRMSKKWTQLLCCVSGEDQDAGCKNQLKKWQEQMAASALAPSPSNFMDILGLVHSLDESNDL